MNCLHLPVPLLRMTSSATRSDRSSWPLPTARQPSPHLLKPRTMNANSPAARWMAIVWPYWQMLWKMPERRVNY